jgi:D-alanyl-D-alanine dipeptidase
MIFRPIRSLAVIVAACFLTSAGPALTEPQKEKAVPLVDIQSVAPTILVELRYATPYNITGRPLYPPKTRALIRPEVARRLAIAEAYLRQREHGLKIWDAYRPKSVQIELWKASPMNDYVADPDTTNGSLHRWGLAVDATLVDSRNQPVKMPTDFDDFTPAAMWPYRGPDREVAANLHLLQAAMNEGGFYGLRSEWWHFIAQDWKKYVPDPNFDFNVHKYPVKKPKK